MRMVDDFLFVTNEPEAARDFLDLMTEGIPEYNFRINETKTRTNFVVDEGDGSVWVKEEGE